MKNPSPLANGEAEVGDEEEEEVGEEEVEEGSEEDRIKGVGIK